MKPIAPVGEHRAVRHLAGERMLEAPDALRMDRLLVDELGARQAREGRGELARRLLRDPLEQTQCEALPDHGGGTEQRLLRFAQPIDARRQHGLHCLGNAVRLDRLREAIATPLTFEVTGLRERAHDLLGEEGVATRARRDSLDERVVRVPPQQLAEQRLRRARRERLEGDLLIVRTVGVGRVVLGTEIVHGQRPRVVLPERHADRVAGRVLPVDVLADEDGRLAPRGARIPHPLGQREEAALAHLRRQGLDGKQGVRHAEELAEKGNLFDQPWIERDEAARDLLARGFGAVPLLDPQRCALEVHEREEGNRFSVGRTARHDHAYAPGACALGQLVTQATLPDARLAHDADVAPPTLR